MEDVPTRSAATRTRHPRAFTGRRTGLQEKNSCVPFVLPEDTTQALGELLGTLPNNVPAPRRFPLGKYRGLSFGLVLDPQFVPEVYLEGATRRQSMLSREHQGPRAILNALERLAGGYGSECESLRQDFAIAEAQLVDYKSRFGATFAHEDYLSELTTLRDQLKSALSDTHAEAVSELPDAAEFAGRIKSLRSTHTIENAPKRPSKRQVSAEEPITARIRKRAESVPGATTVAPANISIADEAKTDKGPKPAGYGR